MIRFNQFLVEQEKKEELIKRFKDTLRPLEMSPSNPSKVLSLHRQEKNDPTIGIGHSLKDKERSRKIFSELFPEKMKDTSYFDRIASGQQSITMDQAERLFDKDVRDRVNTVYRRLPDYEQYSPEMQDRLFSMEYRGSLGGSPKAVELMRSGQFGEAEKEYLNSDEYRSSRDQTPHPIDQKVRDRGIATRMRDDADIIRSEFERLPEGVPGTSRYGPPSPGRESYIEKMSKVAIPEKTAQVRPVETQQSTNTYIIKSGDSLSKIAKGLNVSVQELMKANNISDPNKIRAGSSLKIPSR